MNTTVSLHTARAASEITRKNATLLALQLWRSERLRRAVPGRGALLARSQELFPDFFNQPPAR